MRCWYDTEGNGYRDQTTEILKTIQHIRMSIFGNGLIISQKEDNKLGEINNEGCNIRKR